MNRDELDPLDGMKPELESEPISPEQADSQVAEAVETPIESAAIKPEVGAPDAVEQDGVEPTGAAMEAAPTVSETKVRDTQAVLDSYNNFDNQKAVDRFFEAYRAQKAAERAAAGESSSGIGEQELLPADAPLRRKDGYFYAEPRRLPPPTPFEELVFSYKKPRVPEPTPEIQERWLPPEYLPKGSPAEQAGAAAPAEGEIKVTVEVRLTSEARERIAEQAIAKAAQTHQNHTEIVAKRLYELTREIRDREAARRVLYRR